MSQNVKPEEKKVDVPTAVPQVPAPAPKPAPVGLN